MSTVATSRNPCSESRWSDDPLVTVITITYNRRHTLPRTVESVLGQTLTDFEYIIASDGSTDGTVEYGKAEADPRIRFFELSHRGSNAAFNEAFKHARGDFIAYVPDDDFWEPEFLEKSVHALDESTAPFVFTDYYHFNWETGQRMNRICQRNLAAELYPRRILDRRMAEVGEIFRRRYRQCADWDFYLWVTKQGEPAHLHEPLGNYGMGASHYQTFGQRVAKVFEVVEIANFHGVATEIPFRKMIWGLLWRLKQRALGRLAVERFRH